MACASHGGSVLSQYVGSNGTMLDFFMLEYTTMSELAALLVPYVSRVEAEMRRLVPPIDTMPSFYGQIHYHLGWASERFEPQQAPGGKRVRAAFCLMVCEAFIGQDTLVLPAAAAIELLHEFSLIHDDIEDSDRTRRHRPALWTLVGQPQAINTGDALFALAQRALLQSSDIGVPVATVLHMQQRFNEAAIDLCIGQHRDMSFEGQSSVTPDEYLAMIRGKTAALLGFAGEVGALFGGASPENASSAHKLGISLGLAFQMRDDWLGLWGDPEHTGKPVKSDIRAKKKSLPIVYALAQPESARLRALYRGSMGSKEVEEAHRLIESSGAREYVKALIDDQAAHARQLVDALPAPYFDQVPLARLVELLTAREH